MSGTVRAEHLLGPDAVVPAMPKLCLTQAGIAVAVAAEHGRVVIRVTVDDGAGNRWTWAPSKQGFFAQLAGASFR
jgi:hypothetical protein